MSAPGENVDTHNGVDGPQRCGAKRKKPEEKEHARCDSVDVKLWELHLASSNGDSSEATCRRGTDSQGQEGGPQRSLSLWGCWACVLCCQGDSSTGVGVLQIVSHCTRKHTEPVCPSNLLHAVAKEKEQRRGVRGRRGIPMPAEAEESAVTSLASTRRDGLRGASLPRAEGSD